MPSSRPSPPVILLLVIVVPLMLSSAPCGGSTARPDREGQPSFQPVPLGTDKFQSSGEALGDGHHDGQAQAAALPLAGPPEAPGHLLQRLLVDAGAAVAHPEGEFATRRGQLRLQRDPLALAAVAQG